MRSLVIWDHTVLLAPDRGDSHASTPGKHPAYCQYSFIDSGRMKGWVDLGGWLYQYGKMVYPLRSPIQVLTGLDVE